jgi:hypothetical protein
MTVSDVEHVLTWHVALNAAETDRLIALSTPDIAVGGPRGTGTGAELLRDWVARAGIRLEPRRTYVQGPRVVVEEIAQWRAADGSLTEPLTLASVFVVCDGLVAEVVRYESLEAALEAVGLPSA